MFSIRRMRYQYFANRATPVRFQESAVTHEDAQQLHDNGKAYTVGLLGDEQIESFLDIYKDGAGVACRFYDGLARQEVSYVWNDRSIWDDNLPQGNVKLSQAFGWMYRGDDEQWCRKAMIYFKRDGRLIRRYFNHDTQQVERIVDNEGAKTYEISCPLPEFGNYESFLKAEIEPVFSWLDNWPASVA